MKASEILRYVNGISTPIGGLQWQPPVRESKIAHNLVTFLEDRRVLFDEDQTNEPADYCRKSVEMIRAEVTNALKDILDDSEIKASLRQLRTQCQKFCTEIGQPNFDQLPKAVQDSLLGHEIQQLRKVAGKTIGSLSVSFKLDVDDALASILPFKNRFK